jgi:electron transfer flavoprotein beta subunit
MSVNIAVCLKQVPDPEGPATSFLVNEEEKRVTVTGIPPVVSPFDENSLEAALKIKESSEARLAVFSLGKSLSRAVLLKAMATGVDEAFLVEGETLEAQGLDSFSTAILLAAAIGKVGPFDLILTGRQAADTNAGQVGLGIAQLLDIPAITLAQKVDVSDGKVVVRSALPDGYLVVETGLPALATVSHEVGDLRYPSLKAIKAAKELPVTVLAPDDLDTELPVQNLTEKVGLAAPVRERRCMVVEDENGEEAGKKRAELLFSEKVIH